MVNNLFRPTLRQSAQFLTGVETPFHNADISFGESRGLRHDQFCINSNEALMTLKDQNALLRALEAEGVMINGPLFRGDSRFFKNGKLDTVATREHQFPIFRLSDLQATEEYDVQPHETYTTRLLGRHIHTAVVTPWIKEPLEVDDLTLTGTLFANTQFANDTEVVIQSSATQMIREAIAAAIRATKLDVLTVRFAIQPSGGVATLIDVNCGNFNTATQNRLRYALPHILAAKYGK